MEREETTEMLLTALSLAAVVVAVVGYFTLETQASLELADDSHYVDLYYPAA